MEGALPNEPYFEMHMVEKQKGLNCPAAASGCFVLVGTKFGLVLGNLNPRNS